MTISEHVTEFAGLRVVEFDPETVARQTADPATVAWRLSADYEGGTEQLRRRLSALVAQPWAGQIKALVVGDWGESYETDFPIDDFVAVASTLTSLTALFIGEMTGEENEISWIQSVDLTPLLTAYPGLATLRVRGGDGLELRAGKYPGLRELAFETGGLPAAAVVGVAESQFDNLSHLELWLGTSNYGGDATVEDLAPILSGARLPALKYLGLRDAEIADEVAAALAGAAVVARLEILDLSLGMLSDVGAAALLAGQPLTHLKLLDLHHHFLSQPMIARLHEEFESVEGTVDLSDEQNSDGEDGERYIAVAE
jgi:hypothetical protein